VISAIGISERGTRRNAESTRDAVNELSGKNGDISEI
jgi:hypothetical protein